MTTYVDRLRGCFSMLLAPQLAGTLSIFLHVLGVFEGFGPVGPKEPKVPKVPLIMGFFGGLLGQNFFSLKRPRFWENRWLSDDDFPQLGPIHGDPLGTDPRDVYPGANHHGGWRNPKWICHLYHIHSYPIDSPLYRNIMEVPTIYIYIRKIPFFP